LDFWRKQAGFDATGRDGECKCFDLLGKFAVGWENFRKSAMQEDWLFVYGTLRSGFDGAMAIELRTRARHVGSASTTGTLYHVADYPGFVPGPHGRVTGDLFALGDPGGVLAWLDDYEECTPAHPVPHEYRRERLWVEGPSGAVQAWTYIYAHDVAGLAPVKDGDFLTGAG